MGHTIVGFQLVLFNETHSVIDVTLLLWFDADRALFRVTLCGHLKQNTMLSACVCFCFFMLACNSVYLLFVCCFRKSIHFLWEKITLFKKTLTFVGNIQNYKIKCNGRKIGISTCVGRKPLWRTWQMERRNTRLDCIPCYIHSHTYSARSAGTARDCWLGKGCRMGRNIHSFLA